MKNYLLFGFHLKVTEYFRRTDLYSCRAA